MQDGCSVHVENPVTRDTVLDANSYTLVTAFSIRTSQPLNLIYSIKRRTSNLLRKFNHLVFLVCRKQSVLKQFS